MTKIIGHRGARGLAPENTLASFTEALAAGVDEIELDVRVTKDGICVLNHDKFLHDISGRSLRHMRIADCTLDELQSFRQDIALLEDAIELIDRSVPIIVEVKPRVPTAEVIAVIDRFLAKGWQPSDFLLASFSQRTLRQLHAALPGIEKVVNEHFGGFHATWRARRVQAKRLAFNQHNLWWGFIASMAKHGYKIIAYTVNDPAKVAKWEKRGLFAIVTDYPDRFKK